MRRMLLAISLVIIIITLTGCSLFREQGQGDYVNIDIAVNTLPRAAVSLSPLTRPDGKPFTLAYVDIDPYPVTGTILYYIVMGLRDEGWISFNNLPFDPGDTDAGELVNWLARSDIGPYIRFDESANYYTAYLSEEEIHRSLAEHERNGEIDAIITMGTSPAVMVESFGLQTPVMIFGTVDPIGSGLIESLDDSGNPYIWATFDPTAYERQLLYYYDCVPFSNLGIVYYDQMIAALDSYEKAADSLGIKITRSQITRIDTSSDNTVNAYYEDLRKEFKRLLELEGIDAFMLTTDIILDVERTEYLLEIFTENKIPVFVQVGETLVEHGALMNVSALEMEGFGIFGARSITQALAGTPLQELPQEYRNSPYLVLNLDTAEKIGYKPTFDTLLACERVYTSGAGGD